MVLWRPMGKISLSMKITIEDVLKRVKVKEDINLLKAIENSSDGIIKFYSLKNIYIHLARKECPYNDVLFVYPVYQAHPGL